MNHIIKNKTFDLTNHLTELNVDKEGYENDTAIEYFENESGKYPVFINEYWTSRQRQASSIHEIAYRACFKPQLPRFFIQLLTKAGDRVYDPFAGRGTTAIEAALSDRNIVSNDINIISKILTYPRLNIPGIGEIKERLYKIPMRRNIKADIDLSMFYHPETEAEIVSLKKYLHKRNNENKEDDLDRWIRMAATNRLTGHSPGFFSVYSLPPNQAVQPKRQIAINKKLKQKPEYRDTRKLILKKSVSLVRNIDESVKSRLLEISRKAIFLTKDARYTDEIENESIKLTVTSPPFLDIVQYADDNWLRCWFNGLDSKKISGKITMSRTIEDWCGVMADVFKELYRITKTDGWVAFEVGEIRSGKIKLEEYVVPLGIKAGFKCEAIMINSQYFTKTSNVWGISNKSRGTNTNRIVIFRK